MVNGFFFLVMNMFNFLCGRYWLFEPRSSMHDIGGWYVETFGRDNKGKNVPAQRYWDGMDTKAYFEE